MALLSVIRQWHFREGMPIREITRRTGLSRNTVRKYLASGVLEHRYSHRKTPSKLDDYEHTLTSWLLRESRRHRKQRCSTIDSKFSIKLLASLLILSIVPCISIAHSGTLDKQGGHNDKKLGEYHYHQQPCYTIHKQSTPAIKEAQRDKRPYSQVYNRDDWKHWSDFDGDCMNTRHELLKSSSRGKLKLSPDGCYVSRGHWRDPFSGKTFIRANNLDVDHVVPLKWAHMHGGSNWPTSKKERFANDPDNLLVVNDRLNQQKGAKGPTQWLPSNVSFRCEYLDLWKQILLKYSSLKMSPSEEYLFAKQLRTCP